MEKKFFVYILTNKNNHVLYTGVTGDLINRISQHRSKSINGFTKKYNVTKLVYYEVFNDATSAILREKQIKGGSRKKKMDLIDSFKAEWRDLYEDLI